MPVVGAFDFPPAVTDLSLPYNGVVQIQSPAGSASGTLLRDGRHILTAAHVVDKDVDTDGDGVPDRGDGVVDPGTYTVFFDVPGGRISVPLTPANVFLPNGWDGVGQNGHDVAILELPSLAPFSATRYLRYGGQVNPDDLIEIVGYGRTNFTNPVGTAISGDSGADPKNTGTKRVGYNLVDEIVTKGGDAPENQFVEYDFDDKLVGPAGSPQESTAAPGDSGGPVLIDGTIAGVTSHVETPIQFGSDSWATLVSPFNGWIDGFVDQSYDLVLDMTTQPGGADGNPDTVQVRVINGGAGLEVSVNGNTVQDVALSDVRSITLKGSSDGDTFLVDGRLTMPVTVVGSTATNRLTVDDWGRQSQGSATYSVTPGQVKRTRTGDPNADVLTVNYTNVASVEISTGTGTNIITGAASVPLTVKAEQATNTVIVQKQNVTVRTGGGSPTDFITLAALNTTVDTTASFGDHFITLAAPNTTVNGGPGNDYVSLSYGVSPADAIMGTVTVNGGGGYNSLGLDDSANNVVLFQRATAPTFTITDTSVTRLADYTEEGVGERQWTTTVNYTGLQFIQIAGGNTASAYNVQSTPAGTGLRISSGIDSNAFTLGGPYGLDRLAGPLTLVPGSGFDSLTIDDRNGTTGVGPNGTPETYYDVDAQQVVTSGLTVPLAGFDYLTLLTSNGPDQVSIRGTPAGVPVIVRAGDGADTIDVYYHADGAALQSPVTVDGGAGTDVLTVSDATSGSKGYTLSAGVVEQLGMPDITYDDSVKTVNVLGGPDGDTFQVRSTQAGVTTNVYGRGGADSFSIWSEASTLDDIKGALNLYGGPSLTQEQDVV
jgi:hypothetical protein